MGQSKSGNIGKVAEGFELGLMLMATIVDDELRNHLLGALKAAQEGDEVAHAGHALLWSKRMEGLYNALH